MLMHTALILRLVQTIQQYLIEEPRRWPMDHIEQELHGRSGERRTGIQKPGCDGSHATCCLDRTSK